MSAVRIGFLLLALILSAPFGCESAPDEPPRPLVVAENADDFHEPETVDRRLIVEIWWERDGSVPIRGKSLHFRMYEDRTVEFDYLVSRWETPGRPSLRFSIRRTSPNAIPAEDFAGIEDVSKKLIEKPGVKAEYPGPIALTLDTVDKITIHVNGREGATRTIVVNNSDYDVFDPEYAKIFPAELADLLRRVRSLLDARTEEFTGCHHQTGFAGLTCPDVD